MNDISAAAKVAQNEARDHATGEFGPQPHAESGIVPMTAPTMYADAMRDLEAWADSPEPFAIRVLVGRRAESLLRQMEESRGSRMFTSQVIDSDMRVSTTVDGPTIASYRFPFPTPEAFIARADEVALALRTIPEARTAMGLANPRIPDPTDSRVRIVLICPTPIKVPFFRGTPDECLIAGVRPYNDDSVNDLLNEAAVTVVADFTPWCSEPNDHCVGGDCYYGNHGPLTAEAENDLRVGGYGWVLDDPEEE
jgi:hypothetical protein